MTRKRRRLLLVLACGAGLGSAVALTLSALSADVTFFLLPAAVMAKDPPPSQIFRLGGLVQRGSVVKTEAGGRPLIRFAITDGKAAVPVRFRGVLPDLFREGQGIIALGHLAPGGVFVASEVLAKHDANYMPPAVEAALKKDGLWNPAAGPPPPPATWDTMNPAKPAAKGS